jgi:hypothetical protein
MMMFYGSMHLGMVSPESESQEDEQGPDLKLALGRLQPFLKIAIPFFKEDEVARNSLIVKSSSSRKSLTTC